MNHKKYTYAIAGFVAIAVYYFGFRPIFAPQQSAPAPASVSLGTAGSNPPPTSTSAQQAQEKPFGINEHERPAIDQLKENADSKNPEDVFKNYRILATCYHADRGSKSLNATPVNERDASKKKEMEINQRVRKLCQGVSYSDMAHRLDLLNVAIKAKVRGAAMLYFLEGPFGDADALETRPNDPAVIAWKKQAIAQLEAAAEAGDSDTIVFLIQIYSFGEIAEKDPVKVYTYTIAQHAVQELESKAQPYSQKYLEYLRKDLSPAQITQAEEKAKALVQACCSSRTK